MNKKLTLTIAILLAALVMVLILIPGHARAAGSYLDNTPTRTPAPTATPYLFPTDPYPPAPTFGDSGIVIEVPKIEINFQRHYSLLPPGFSSWPEWWQNILDVAIQFMTTWWPIFSLVISVVFGFYLLGAILNEIRTFQGNTKIGPRD